jgi:hypothetical protein
VTAAHGHTAWCTAGHRCNLGEHRSAPIIAELPGHARAVLTRVRAANGSEHAEIRIRVSLHPTEPAARRQLAALLSGLRHLITAATTPRRTIA